MLIKLHVAPVISILVVKCAIVLLRANAGFLGCKYLECFIYNTPFVLGPATKVGDSVLWVSV